MPKSIKKAMILLPIIVKSKVGVARDKILSKVRKSFSGSYSKNVFDEKTNKSWKINIRVSNGNCKHIADDILSKKVVGDRRIHSLGSMFEKSKFIKKSGLTKERSDNRIGFYYFKHPRKKIYFNVAKSFEYSKSGRKKYFYELYSITKEIK